LLTAEQHHPDKNPHPAGSPEAEAVTRKFQEVSPLLFPHVSSTIQIGEAYQVLSNPALRSKYDKFGIDAAKPSSGFGEPHMTIRLIK
jgi:DnaJ-class molecular chaperone